jgi:hypothetical protein
MFAGVKAWAMIALDFDGWWQPSGDAITAAPLALGCCWINGHQTIGQGGGRR